MWESTAPHAAPSPTGHTPPWSLSVAYHYPKTKEEIPCRVFKALHVCALNFLSNAIYRQSYKMSLLRLSYRLLLVYPFLFHGSDGSQIPCSEEAHVARNWRRPLANGQGGTEVPSQQSMRNWILLTPTYVNLEGLPPLLEPSDETEEPANTLVVETLNQRIQLIHVLIPDSQKLWDNQCLGFKTPSLESFVTQQ